MIRGGNVDRAVIFNINFRAGLFDDAANHFSAWANHGADFFRVNLHAEDARRILRQFLTRQNNRFFHLRQDMKTPFSRLNQGKLEGFMRNAADFQIHLNGGDADFRASHF